MEHPKTLPAMAVEYWEEQVAALVQRKNGVAPLPLTMIAFYTDTSDRLVGHVIIASNWQECRILQARTDMPFERVPSVGYALREFALKRGRLRVPAKNVAVYVRDVTIGEKFALATVHVAIAESTMEVQDELWPSP